MTPVSLFTAMVQIMSAFGRCCEMKSRSSCPFAFTGIAFTWLPICSTLFQCARASGMALCSVAP